MLQVLMPPMAADATVRRWYRREGDYVEAGEPLAEVTGSTGRFGLAAPAAGTLAALLVPAGQAAAPGAALANLVPLAASGAQVVPLSPVRQAIARHMTYSVHTSPHVTVVSEVDASRLCALREHHKEAFSRRFGVPLTYLPFFLQATVAGLRRRPVMNAELTATGVVLKRYINLGFVVSVPGHVVTPVIRGADRLGLVDLARTARTLIQRARAGQLAPADLAECTFSITNTGASGGHILGTPIIQQPNVGILSFETITKRPVAIGETVAVRPMMYLCLSFDHRVADGADADAFLDEVRAWLSEVPVRW